MTLLLRQRPAAERHAVVEHHVVADLAVSPMTTPMPWSMKKRRPMVAPGWISMPVRNRVNCARIRAGPFRAGTCHIRCAMRCDQIACSPE